MALLKFVIGVLGLLLFGAISIHFGEAGRIENEIETAASKAFAGVSADWASISVSGRKAVLSGAAPSDAERDRVINHMKAATGAGPLFHPLLSVEFTGTVEAHDKKAPEFRWQASYDGDMLQITGVAPTARAKSRAFAEAIDSFPEAKLDDKSVAAGGGPDEEWAEAARLSLRALSLLDRGRVSGRRMRLSLSGATSDPALAEGAARTMESVPLPYAGAGEISLSEKNDGDAAADSENAVQPGVSESDDPIGDLVEAATAHTAAEAKPMADIEKLSAQECQNRLDRRLAKAPIAFASASAALESRARARLDAIAQDLETCGIVTVLVEGHTDSSGNRIANQRLSGRRAETVAGYLRNKDIERITFSSSGAGSGKPVSSNATSAGRARNRRIEFIVSPSTAN